MHFDSALNAPIKDRMELQVFGGSAKDKAEILWVLGVKVPAFHCHPKIMVFIGHISVLEADKLRLLDSRRFNTRYQVIRISFSEFPHTKMSSANKITNPS